MKTKIEWTGTVVPGRTWRQLLPPKLSTQFAERVEPDPADRGLPYIEQPLIAPGYTFNCWIGCTKVSPGCANCYAEADFAKRRKFVEWGSGKLRRRTSKAYWQGPIGWNERTHFHVDSGEWCQPVNMISSARLVGPLRPKVFCASLADWLDREVPVEWLAELLTLIDRTPNLDWLLLTKRPELCSERMNQAAKAGSKEAISWLTSRGPANVWLGASVENRDAADERIPSLLRIPAAKHFLSMEPLLGPVDLSRWLVEQNKFTIGDGELSNWRPQPDWVIVGGESGKQARPCDAEWIRNVKDQCQNAGVPVFVKQLGSFCVDRNDRGFEGDSGKTGWPMDTTTTDNVEPGMYQGKRVRVRLKNRKGGDMLEWPEDLRVREWPA
jgi:protein gp37